MFKALYKVLETGPNFDYVLQTKKYFTNLFANHGKLGNISVHEPNTKYVAPNIEDLSIFWKMAFCLLE